MNAGSQVLAWGRDPPPPPIPDSIFFKAYVDVCYTKKFIINAKFQWYIYIFHTWLIYIISVTYIRDINKNFMSAYINICFKKSIMKK